MVPGRSQFEKPNQPTEELPDMAIDGEGEDLIFPGSREDGMYDREPRAVSAETASERAARRQEESEAATLAVPEFALNGQSHRDTYPIEGNTVFKPRVPTGPATGGLQLVRDLTRAFEQRPDQSSAIAEIATRIISQKNNNHTAS